MRRPVRRRLLRIAGWTLVTLIVIVAASAVWLRGVLTGSLPQLEGEVVLAALEAPVLVERDALGIPAIRASSRLDLARATGFVHAQERMFQMDLLRRQAAGELAELFGPAALELDRAHRVHRFRAIARETLAASPLAAREMIEAFAAGANAGLSALGAAPPEYQLLRLDPVPWRPEDTVLCVLAMYLDLQAGDGARESALGVLVDVLPPALVAFLTPPGDEWDAPLVGGPLLGPPIPGPEVLDLGRREPLAASAEGLSSFEPPPVAGSNNWAVAGTHTASGAALVANDMHLGLGLPNIWYRASLVWSEPRGVRRVTGVALPGSPWIVAGSNGRIAWGFTNSQIDTSDLVVLEMEPGSESRYRTAEGARDFVVHDERLAVKGGAAETLAVRWTLWGPVVDEDHRGRPRALRWVAHDPAPLGVGLDELETAGDVDAALAIAARAAIPTQNLVVGDARGRIGWTLMGPVPQRFGHDGRTPRSWADGRCGWAGRLPPEAIPRIVDPASGRLWTANNRTVDGQALERIGEGGFDLGARAGQIRDRLHSLEGAREADMLAIQLDDRALFLERWRTFLLELLSDAAVAGVPRREELRRLVRESWDGHASVDSVGYRAVRGFRLFLARRVFGDLTKPCKETDARFEFLAIGRWEDPLWRLVHEKPAHLVPPAAPSWDAMLLETVDALVANLLETGEDLAQRTWGERNTVRMRHPFSSAVPWLSRWLDVPDERLPGDAHMPRVQGPTFGASERMAVTPGREEDGLFHMPGGQSGHPLSPFYREGHRAWAEGRPTPFLPGAPAHRLTLSPPPRP